RPRRRASSISTRPPAWWRSNMSRTVSMWSVCASPMSQLSFMPKAWSPVLRQRLNEKYKFQHPELPDINRLSHILWTGKPKHPQAHARNAVFYGDKAIDRSPCGTGTSARMAQLAAKGKLKPGDEFIHESIIGSLFHGRVERAAEVAGRPAIVPSIAGWARMTGYNTIFIDDRDPFAHGFSVA
ncbi:LOW QUALITY PROTEIN: proline racemase, partial [Brucella suis bv. 5 str. 513]